MRTPRWLLVALSALIVVSAGACSCSQKLAGLFGKKAAATPTAEPTVVLMPLVIPKQSGEAFEGEMGEDELEELVSELIGKEALEYISEVDVQISPESLLANVRVSAGNLNITFKVTIAGVPQVVEGKVYLQITQVILDDSLSGWTRLSAKSLVQGAIDKYAGENGIQVGFDDLWIDEVELRQDRLYVRGKTL